jgi:DNA polymerase-3 subunit gamma/tau
MAYEVTAARRRPKTFDELAGQEFVAATLKNSLDKGHIAHAYLFSGPRGCGKTSAARILARALRCEKGPCPQPCGICSQCLEILRGASMDVLEIDGASNTSVNDVRQIKEELLFPPGSGRYKVYIIDEVHMLSNSAFNALLKTIEEPPPNVVFIFATTELQKVPATIRSRCQQFNFRLISVETITALLREACNESGIKTDDEALLWIARESTGSCRDAYTLLDQVVSFSEGHIRMELIREKLGLVGLDELNQFAEACALGDFTRSISLLDSILFSGVAIETLITGLASYYHSLLLIKAGVSRETILGYPPSRFSADVLNKYDPVRLERAGELLYALYRDIRYSVSPRFELETLVSKLCWLDKWISRAELADAVSKVKGILKSGEGVFREEGIASQKSFREGFSGSEETQKDGANSGSFTEEFKRHMAQRGSPEGKSANYGQADSVPEDLEPGVRNVLEVFNGTIVGEGSE